MRQTSGVDGLEVDHHHPNLRDKGAVLCIFRVPKPIRIEHADWDAFSLHLTDRLHTINTKRILLFDVRGSEVVHSGQVVRPLLFIRKVWDRVSATGSNAMEVHDDDGASSWIVFRLTRQQALKRVAQVFVLRQAKLALQHEPASSVQSHNVRAAGECDEHDGDASIFHEMCRRLAPAAFFIISAG